MKYKNYFVRFNNGYSESTFPDILGATNSALNFLTKHNDFRVEIFCGKKRVAVLDKSILKSLKPSKVV